MKSAQNLAAAAMLINGVAAAGMMKPAIMNETEPNTAKTFVATVTSDYSFYFPEPTAFSHGGVTCTVTEPMYVTVTNCPYEVTMTQNPMPPEAPVIPPAPPAPPAPALEKPAPPPSPPQVSAPKPGPPPPPPPTGPPPPVRPVPSAAANRASGNLGVLIVAGVAALAI